MDTEQVIANVDSLATPGQIRNFLPLQSSSRFLGGPQVDDGISTSALLHSIVRFLLIEPVLREPFSIPLEFLSAEGSVPRIHYIRRNLTLSALG